MGATLDGRTIAVTGAGSPLADGLAAALVGAGASVVAGLDHVSVALDGVVHAAINRSFIILGEGPQRACLISGLLASRPF